MAIPFVTKKISPIRRCKDVLSSFAFCAIFCTYKNKRKKRRSLNLCAQYNSLLTDNVYTFVIRQVLYKGEIQIFGMNMPFISLGSAVAQL